jgi:hypothetical protein
MRFYSEVSLEVGLFARRPDATLKTILLSGQNSMPAQWVTILLPTPPGRYPRLTAAAVLAVY